uniref:HABP4_PAI-RBP1 domain-containing protein n=1 Tax=Macrostomum lignano TaxID=282301 RepID=A0A1I8FR89_9PLAT
MTWEDFVLDQLMMERQYPAAKKRRHGQLGADESEEAEKLAERQAEIAEALARRNESETKSTGKWSLSGRRCGRGFGQGELQRKADTAGDSGQGEAEREEMRYQYNIQKKEEFNPMPDGEDVARQAWPQAQDAGGAGGGARPRGSGRLCLLPARRSSRHRQECDGAVPQKMISDAQREVHYSVDWAIQ